MLLNSFILQYSIYVLLFPPCFRDTLSSQGAVDFVSQKLANVSLLVLIFFLIVKVKDKKPTG